MPLIKEEKVDIEIRETFRVKQEKAEEQTDEQITARVNTTLAEITNIKIEPGVVTRPTGIRKPEIYIIGDSCVRYGQMRARETIGVNLGLDARVQWFGFDGMVWENLLSSFRECLRTRAVPDVLLIHCGGNDLGILKSVMLCGAMKRELLELHSSFPQMKIVFSAITQRRMWRSRQPKKINKARRFINSVMAVVVLSIGGSIVQHPQITHRDFDLFICDGFNFSDQGNDIFLKNIAQGLKDHIN